MTQPDNTIELLRNDEILKHQGIYKIGSKQERYILNLRSKIIDFVNQANSLPIRAEVNGEFVLSDILPRMNNYDILEATVPPADYDEIAAFRMFDGPSLVKFDSRVRWCRMTLCEVSPTKDIDDIRAILTSQKPRTRNWYAAKCLAHSGRTCEIVNRIGHDTPISDFSLFGLFRELIAFGETWSEANFIINHGEATISGTKYRKKSREGAEKRLGSLSDHTPHVLAEMRRLIGAGRSASTAASIAAKKGIGASPEANRQLWYRHRNKL